MKKAQLFFFPVLAALTVWLWYGNSAAAPAGSLFAGREGWLLAAARLAGILGALGVLGQLLVMSRAPWLEPLTGDTLPAAWHHRAGLLIPLLLLVHPPLAVWHHALLSGLPFAEQYASVLGWEGVAFAAAAEALIIGAVLLSLPFARRRLPYPAWQKIHLGVYAGLALSIGHQLALGGDLNAEKPHFAWAWYALLAFTAANSIWYRALKPRLGRAA